MDDEKIFNGTILIAEDNEDDIFVTRRAFKKEAAFQGALFVAEDGEQALDYLNNEDKQAHPIPDVLLLDINMPKLTGLQVLEKVKADAKLKNIVCIMLTTSENENDINTAYSLGAAGFIPKPISFTRFAEVVGKLSNFMAENKFPEK